MRPFIVCCTLAISFLCFSLNAAALGFSMEGNDPVGPANYTDWPGAEKVVDNPSRIFQVWVNGSETNYFRGDTASLNVALEHFAAIQVPVHEIALLPGPGKARTFGEEEFTYDWRLNLLGGISHFLHKEEVDTQVYDDHPTMTVFVGDGNIELAQLVIPRGVTVMQLDDLRARYYAGLRSENQQVREAAVGRLAAIDPYGEESLARIIGTYVETYDGTETWEEMSAPRFKYIDPARVATRLQHFGKPARAILVNQLTREDVLEEQKMWIRKAIQFIDDLPDTSEAVAKSQKQAAAIAQFLDQSNFNVLR